MKIVILLIVFPLALMCGNKDSLVNKHYVIKFSIQGNVTKSNVNYQFTESYISEGKSSSNGFKSLYQSPINSNAIINPILKIDFELPVWLKITCGASYNKTVFKTAYIERNYWQQQTLYDPNSTPWSYTVTGSSTYTTKKEYLKDDIEMDALGTFLGVGFCRQVKRFNVDMDYSLCFNRIMNSSVNRSVFDDNYLYLKTDIIRPNSNNINQYGNFFTTQSISTSVGYKLFKRFSFKAGIQISIYDQNINMVTDGNTLIFKKMKAYSLFGGFYFSII